jgi:predicted metal-dependent peptidase
MDKAESSAGAAVPAASPRELRSRLEKVIVRLLFAYPFYARVLSKAVRGFTDSVDTLAVTELQGKPLVLVNPRFFFETLETEGHRMGALIHEVLHIVLRHVTRGVPGRRPDLWRYACDLAVNELIPAELLPPGAITAADFPDAAIWPGMSAEQIHTALLRAAGEGGGDGDEAEDEESVDEFGEAGPSSVGPGGAGVPGVPAGPLRRPVGSHERWPGPAGKGGDLEIVISHEIAQAWDMLPEAARGSLPGSLRRFLGECASRKAAPVDWRRVLRVFCSSCGGSELRATISRPSRRYGTVPGTRVRRYQRLGVALDTSGSIDGATLALFFAQIEQIRRLGIGVTVIECDAELGRVWEYRGRVPEAATGGGGTDFEPVFAWLKRNRCRHPVDGIVYLTDGQGAMPRTKAACRVLWVLSPGSPEPEAPPFGTVIRMAAE